MFAARVWICLATITAAAAHGAPDERASLFDPSRHMRVSEVREGMTGYGLSVFKGTKIERFNVEVVSVLRNFNPKYDVVLIKCSGANLEHTGSVSGMSGSPIFLKDNQGRERMIGAFAYGWPLMKDPLAGVQPIEYMLALPDPKPNEAANARTAIRSAAGDAAQKRARWSLSDCVLLPGMTTPPRSYPLAKLGSLDPNPSLLTGGADDATRLAPLVTPLLVAGVPQKLLDQFHPLFRAYGLTPFQTGGVGGSASPDAAVVGLEPGSTLAAPLLTGDIEMTAVGTCTETIGDRVFGFGHSFNDEGPISLPMAAGQVNGIVASINQSWKLGAYTKIHGTLTTDQTVGVAGRVGAAPPLVPMELRVVYADGSIDQTYRFNVVRHPKFTPLLASVAMSVAASAGHDFPQNNTLDYNFDIEFTNGQKVTINNSAVDAVPAALLADISLPMIAASDNPFERVGVSKINGTMRVVGDSQQASIVSVNVPKLKFRAGETVKAYVSYRPFRAAEAVLPVELELPHDLPNGNYRMVVCDSQRFLQDEITARPFRFTSESIDEVFEMLRDFA
ncbi:MAG: hypothetical protein ACREJC_06620, partial [Tepidisphaeraceae bacterium]